MPTPPLQELWDAFDAGDADRIRAIFSTTTLGPEKAQDLLEEHLGQIVRPNKVTRALLDSGASLKDVSLLAIGACCSIEVFRLLAKDGLSFKEEGHTILEDFVQDREVIDFLLDQGVDINQPDDTRDTRGERLPPGVVRSFDKTLGVLNNTAALGDIELFDHLVSRGADISKSIALHTATRCSSPAKTRAMIQHLIEKYEFDPNADDNASGLRNLSGIVDGRDDSGPPLEFAIRHHNFAAVRTLLEKGADPNAAHPVTGPLSIHAVWGFQAVVELFLKAGADANIILSAAIKDNDVTTVKLCLRYEVNPKSILKEIKDMNLKVDPQIIALLSDE